MVASKLLKVCVVLFKLVPVNDDVVKRSMFESTPVIATTNPVDEVSVALPPPASIVPGETATKAINKLPALFRVMLPPLELIVPKIFMAPVVFVIEMSPPPLFDKDVPRLTLKFAAEVFKEISPLVVLLPLTLPNVLASSKMVPPTEEMDKPPALVMVAPVSCVIVPLLVNETPMLLTPVLIPFTVPKSSVKLERKRLLLLTSVTM